jgi:hypothetical protein
MKHPKSVNQLFEPGRRHCIPRCGTASHLPTRADTSQTRCWCGKATRCVPWSESFGAVGRGAGKAQSAKPDTLSVPEAVSSSRSGCSPPLHHARHWRGLLTRIAQLSTKHHLNAVIAREGVSEQEEYHGGSSTLAPLSSASTQATGLGWRQCQTASARAFRRILAQSQALEPSTPGPIFQCQCTLFQRHQLAPPPHRPQPPVALFLLTVSTPCAPVCVCGGGDLACP